MPLWRTRVARSAAAARLHGAKIWRRGRCRALPMGSVSSGDNADVASHFYTELWSGTFVLFLRVGAVSLSMGVLRLMTNYRLHRRLLGEMAVITCALSLFYFPSSTVGDVIVAELMRSTLSTSFTANSWPIPDSPHHLLGYGRLR